MSITTRKGDDGTTSLRFGKRVLKTCARVEAYGSVDELSAFIGVTRAHFEGKHWMYPALTKLQPVLLAMGGILAVASEDMAKIPKEEIEEMETGLKLVDKWIVELEAKLPRFREFTFPGANLLSADLHVARTVARRAERHIWRMKEAGEQFPDVIVRYMNRLSDFLWLLARCGELDVTVVLCQE